MNKKHTTNNFEKAKEVFNTVNEWKKTGVGILSILPPTHTSIFQREYQSSGNDPFDTENLDFQEKEKVVNTSFLYLLRYS